MAGHSKWANIQHRKGKQDKIRAKLFSKLSKEITVAAKMGDPDPDKNPRLRLAVKEARASSMQRDVIDRAIKKSQGGDAESYESIRYEGYGPGGIAVIVEALTDNRNRTASNVRSTFGKNGGNLGETNSVAFQFERKGEIFYAPSAGDLDTVMVAALEAGAEDELGTVSAALEASLGESETTKFVWRPKVTTPADGETFEKLMRLVEVLEDDDDVHNVTTNVEASQEVMAAYADS